jgi:hypothetical protein
MRRIVHILFLTLLSHMALITSIVILEGGTRGVNFLVSSWGI